MAAAAVSGAAASRMMVEGADASVIVTPLPQP
jgi:hypothetical protein